MPSLHRYVARLVRCSLIILLAGHFAVMFLATLHFDPGRLGKFAAAFEHYGQASGASSEFAFFSPGISSQLRVRFTVKKRDNTIEEVEFMRQVNRETDLRLGDISDQFFSIATAERPVAKKLQRLLAASLAAHTLSRYPDAHSVTVNFEEYIPSSLKQPMERHPIEWQSIYSVEFSLDQKGEAP